MRSSEGCARRMPAVIFALLVVSSRGSAEGDRPAAKEARGLFSPRVDYDEWTPLGRGDPLKNDPTYDYVPPVLERVHYWVDPSSSSRTQPSPERRAPPPPPPPPPAASRKDAFDPFLKFIDGPKFGRPPPQQQYQRYQPPPPPPGASYYYRTSVSAPEPQVVQHLHTVLVPPPTGAASRSPPTPLPMPTPTPTPGVVVEVQRAELAHLSSSSAWLEGCTHAAATVAQPSSRVVVTATAPAYAAPAATTAAAPALTTDPLFSHYKQPAQPLRGPMYLIIQGHSKVKTYGSVLRKRNSYHGIPVRDDDGGGDNDIRQTDRSGRTPAAAVPGE